ncbi:FHA domain-containing protein [Xylanimonas allomyrinae]|uniref:FHA domain-containing protein n=1 Tax=Xylanimonas allomyrinae TaxID=2509459 RepID=A0A4P6EJX5_9MICO|nr:FHA domain-containing protein [Xylanimonas allomyrinae]QAY62685.1 FHA domain-containing protein [Xylanimonas allomyrinae]
MTDPSSLPQPPAADVTATLGRIVPVAAEELVPRLPLTSEDAAAVGALPRHSALLVVQRGAGVGERFLLDTDRAVAGRSETADIFLDDVTVSRKHAEIVREGDRFVVRDIGSLNGTYVNRQRIDAAVLSTGDEVQIGKFRMSFQASPQAVQPPQASRDSAPGS